MTGRTSGVTAFWWTLQEGCARQLLPYVFADAEDDRQQYTMVVNNVTSRLAREAQPAGEDGAVLIDGVTCRTYGDFVDKITELVTDDATMTQWAGNAIGAGTIYAFLRRLRSSQRALTSLIRGDLPDPSGTSGPAGAVRGREITTDGQQVTVIDLHNLPERAQRFVVGVVLAAETARKEAAGPGSLLFTMIDELNKYAPREGASPIKDVLLDIAERGRSLGIIRPRAAGRGGVVTFTAPSTGETVNIAVLPFLSQRWAIRAADLLTQTPAEAAGSYDQQIRELLTHLKTGFTPGAVNLAMAHLTVSGAVHGGGERAAQTIFEY